MRSHPSHKPRHIRLLSLTANQAHSYEPDSPLAKEAEYVAVYDWGENAQAINTNYGVLYQIVFGALHVLENHPAFEQAIDGLNKLQTVYNKSFTPQCFII